MTETPSQSDKSTEEEAEESRASLIGTTISGRYRIESLLGEGGMGSVFLAEHTLMRKRLAIKILHPEMTRLPEVVERFEREAMAAAHIEHPNVAAATDFGKLEDGSFFLVLEYVQGKSLRDVIGDGPMPPQRAVHIASQIASALARAHGLGIVHRDMKPENVMLVERDSDPDFVKVLDFGIAKVPVAEIVKDAPAKSRKALTQLGMVYGTPEYMAPEQALGQDVDARADLYALGTILYEMLAGVRPFEADNPVTLLGLQATKPPPPIHERSPLVSVPAPVESLVLLLLEKEAAKRPKDAREVVESLETIKTLWRVGSSPQIAPLSLPDVQVSEAATARTSISLVPPLVAVTTGAWKKVQPLATRGQESVKLLLVRVEPAVAEAMAALRTRFPTLGQKVEALKSKLPTGLQRIPVLGWLGAIVGSGVLLLILGALLLCGSPRLQTAHSFLAKPVSSASASGSAPKAAPLRPTDEQIKEATTQGPEAIEQLIEKYPASTDLYKVLGRSYMAVNKPEQALEAYKKLLAADPSSAEDIEIGQNIVLACQSDGASEAAYAMLENDLGPRGLDLLHWLAYESKAQTKYQLKAARALSKKATRERGTPALQIALEFRNAGSCDAKYRLLERARTEGDKRTYVQLQPLFYTKGCGFLSLADCWKCMRKSTLLASAAKEIESRMSQASDAGSAATTD